MRPESFTNKKFGRLLKTPQDYWAFVPENLPPEIPLDWNLINRLTQAQRELAHLNGLAHNLPNPHLLIGPFVRREAVLSSRIEGTQASLSELFFFEAAGKSAPDQGDVAEVLSYVRAMEYGLKRVATLPISIRLMGELHQRLMAGNRGGHLTPGDFRRSQNWIGPANCSLDDATYVPPPVPEMLEALANLEKFIHQPSPVPALIRLALIHYQFEAIHPYLDGNGRIGRLLITLILCVEKLLQQPLLYLSAFFEKNRAEYYRLLLAVSQRGEWPAWIDFFLRGVAEQSRDAILRTEKMLTLQRKYTRTLQTARSSALVLRLLDELFNHPVISIAHAARILKVTPRSAALNIRKLVSRGVLDESTGRERNRLFVARKILQIAEAENLGDPPAP